MSNESEIKRIIEGNQLTLTPKEFKLRNIVLNTFQGALIDRKVKSPAHLASIVLKNSNFWNLFLLYYEQLSRVNEIALTILNNSLKET